MPDIKESAKEAKRKSYQRAREIVRAYLARLTKEYEEYKQAKIKGDIPIFDATPVMKGLGLDVITANKSVPFQFVDITKRQVERFNSRRELEEFLGDLSDEDFRRYENLEAIVILKDQKPVKFHSYG